MKLFNPTSHVLVDCLHFCFIVFLRKELKETATKKNKHTVSTEDRLVDLIQNISCQTTIIIKVAQIHL